MLWAAFLLVVKVVAKPLLRLPRRKPPKPPPGPSKPTKAQRKTKKDEQHDEKHCLARSLPKKGIDKAYKELTDFVSNMSGSKTCVFGFFRGSWRV